MVKRTYTPPPLPAVNVLQVLPALGDGGVEQSAVEMALYIKSQGWGSFVASAGGPKTALLQQAGIRHFTLPLQRKAPWAWIYNAWRLGKIVRRERIGLIHARSRGPAWSCWVVCRVMGVPYVTTFHGTYGLGGGFLKRFYNSVMTWGPVTIANSAYIKDHIIVNYGIYDKNIIVAPRGVEAERFNPALYKDRELKKVRAEMGGVDGVPMLVMVGRLTPWKGHELLLRALGQLQDLPWRLAVVGGEGKNSDFGAKMRDLGTELGLEGRIRWLGSREDVPRLLAAADLGLSCSVRPEAFGRVAIETMAMAKPIVATALGGSLETVVEGKTGWLVHPDGDGVIRPQALAQTLREALREPARLARMGHDARRHVLAHFTAAKCCAAEMEAYHRVLGRP